MISADEPPAGDSYRGKLRKHLALMHVCIMYFAAQLVYDDQFTDGTKLLGAWAYLKPVISRAIGLKVISFGFSDANVDQIKIVVAALPNALRDFMTSAAAELNYTVRLDTITQYFMFGPAIAISLVICRKAGCSCRMERFNGFVVKRGVTQNRLFGLAPARYAKRFACLVPTLLPYTKQTLALIGFLEEKLLDESYPLS